MVPPRGVAALISVSLAAACASHDPIVSGAPPLALALVVRVVAPGAQAVTLGLQVTNLSDTSIVLRTAREDFAFHAVVRVPNGVVVWDRLSGVPQVEPLTLVTLAPHTMREFVTTWPLSTDAQERVPSGLYEVNGTLTGLPATMRAPPRVIVVP